MNTYIKFIITTFFKSFIFVFLIIFSLVFILNILSELDFFRNIKVEPFFPIYISILNSPSLIFEMFPFIFLISTQVFFINLFSDNQIEIFKYSGLKNSKIVNIIGLFSFFLGIFVITIFYNLSSNLKNVYLELKNKYSSDDKYLAVITKNGLWIKDKINDNITIVNASKIDGVFLKDTIISEFNKDFDIQRNIQSNKINIKNKEWIAYNVTLYENNTVTKKQSLTILSNFDYEKIQSLFSNLSSLSIFELINLKKNYGSLNYSTTEVDLQLLKVISYPFYLTLMTFLSSVIMFASKQLKSSTFKISFGLFASVVIYYINNFFNVMGKTEKISLIPSIIIPLALLILINAVFLYRINEK
ncbi:LptF/LptG family permease [Candidatus Pelagibacter sp.]|jgi:lipopolysaccharide export system permease protein|nr:LptF/LptG family permease [Candidatus Pelagibacter sp.]